MKPNPTDPYHPAKLYGLDHLRAYAISFVLIFHYQFFGHPAWIEPIAKFGWTGVDLFFVLSGYLISSQLFNELTKTSTISLKNFFIKRSFRILPAYWVVVAIYFFIPAFREREALPPLWRFFTFTQDITLNVKTEGTFSHAWSLCVEEQFYLLLPLVLLLIFRSGWFKKAGYLLIAIVMFSFIARLLSWNLIVARYIGQDNFYIIWYKWIYYVIYNRLDPLIIGIAIAALKQYKPGLTTQMARFGNTFLLTGLMVLVGAYFVCMDEHSYTATLFGFPVVALGYGLIVFGAISPQSLFYKYRLWLTEKIAGLSFGIYLIHKGVIHLTQQALEGHVKANSIWMMLICMAVVVFAALLLQLLVEKPFLKLRKRFLNVN